MIQNYIQWHWQWFVTKQLMTNDTGFSTSYKAIRWKNIHTYLHKGKTKIIQEMLEVWRSYSPGIYHIGSLPNL